MAIKSSKISLDSGLLHNKSQQDFSKENRRFRSGRRGNWDSGHINLDLVCLIEYIDQLFWFYFKGINVLLKKSLKK